MTNRHRMFRDQLPNAQRVAYGYVRVDDTDGEAVAQFRRDIAACCVREELRLANTFCDLGDDGSTLARPALGNLLEALKATPSATPVVPDLNHLSPFPTIRSVLLLTLHRTEHQIVIAHEPNGRAHNFGAQYGVWVGLDGNAEDEPS